MPEPCAAVVPVDVREHVAAFEAVGDPLRERPSDPRRRRAHEAASEGEEEPDHGVGWGVVWNRRPETGRGGLEGTPGGPSSEPRPAPRVHPAQPHPAPMALKTGDRAPDVQLYDDATEPFSLQDALADGPVVLLFFPGAFTSVCTSELSAVGNDYDRYRDLGATVVGVSTDSPFALAEFKSVNKLPFSLLSDHDGAVSAAYGAKYDHDFTPMGLDRISKRAAFVVGEDGTLRYAEVLDNAGEQPDFDAVLESLQADAA